MFYQYTKNILQGLKHNKTNFDSFSSIRSTFSFSNSTNLNVSNKTSWNWEKVLI